MKISHAFLRAVVAGGAAALFMAAPARANSITETFNVTIFPAATLTGDDRFPTTLFPQFNPADGTLNNFTTTLTGPATWTSATEDPLLTANLSLHNSDEEVNVGQFFHSPGALTINFDGTDSFTPDFATLIGTGTATLVFRL